MWTVVSAYFFEIIIVCFCCVGFCLAVVPVYHYTRFGYRERREEIVHYFNDRAIVHYFERFRRAQKTADAKSEFAIYYDQRFGSVSYRYPITVYLAALIAAMLWVAGAALQVEDFKSVFKFASGVAWALAGAYFWVVQDLLLRFARRDIVPAALYGYSFRFVICVPLTYALGTILHLDKADGHVQAALAFMLGVFPTSTLILIMRRQIFQRFGLGDEIETRRYELEDLQGVTTSIAEKFSDLGIMTNVQLAYEDPIQMTMRMNLPFRFIIDVMSQALLVIYCPELDVLRKYSIRSSMDAATLYDELHDDDKEVKDRSRAVVDALASELKVPSAGLEKMLREIGGDPANKFLTELPF